MLRKNKFAISNWRLKTDISKIIPNYSPEMAKNTGKGKLKSEGAID